MSPLYFSKARPTPLTWEINREKDTVWVALNGAVDLFSFRAFDKLLDETCQGEGKDVVLDCDQLRYLNSRALASIFRHHHLCREQKGRLILCRPNGKISENLKMMGLDGVLKIAPDVASVRAEQRGEMDG